MWNGVYYILVVVVAVWGIFSGFRRGFLRQTGGVLGMAFGIVAARMLHSDFMPTVDSWIPPFVNGFNRTYICQTLSCGVIYLGVALVVGLCTMPVGRLIGMLGSGMLDSIGGAVFRLFQLLLVLSIMYNLLADMTPTSDLTRSSSRHDGNIVEGVMQIAPPILGFPGAEEVAFRQQMEDARKIS